MIPWMKAMLNESWRAVLETRAARTGESRACVHRRPQNAPATQRGIESIDRLHQTSRRFRGSRRFADRGRVSTPWIGCNSTGRVYIRSSARRRR